MIATEDLDDRTTSARKGHEPTELRPRPVPHPRPHPASYPVPRPSTGPGGPSPERGADGRAVGGRAVLGRAVGGAVAALAALATVWAAGSTLDGTAYVSQMGAEEVPTSGVFNGALLVLAVGGLLVAGACRGERASVRVLGAWSASTTLVVAGLAFLVASRVTCTTGCPVPLTAGSTVQDLVHVAAAVVGFAAAACAMLQVGWSHAPRLERLVSRAAALAVGAAAGAGALLSAVGVRTDVGARLEWVAMTVAVLWLAGYALRLPARGPQDRRRAPAPEHVVP